MAAMMIPALSHFSCWCHDLNPQWIEVLVYKLPRTLSFPVGHTTYSIYGDRASLPPLNVFSYVESHGKVCDADTDSSGSVSDYLTTYKYSRLRGYAENTLHV